MNNENKKESDTPETDEQINGKPCTRFAIAAGDSLRDALVPSEFARKLERERDEAREEAEHWKTEYEIVVARLCGKKHPRDNGIISEHEIIHKLERARDEARGAICELLKLVPRASCEMFHHEKKDKHGYDEKCPLVERYNAKIKKAEEAAK